MFDEIVYLLTMIDEENGIGDPIRVPVKGDYIFADKKSIRQTEFYQASANGLKPELMFEIHAFEYNGETMLEYDGKPYNIIRTYKKDIEFIELICEGGVNNAIT